jgi:hypothetical protein
MSFISDFIDRIFGKREQQAPTVVVARPTSEAEAQMIRERLANAGVPAIVQNRDAGSSALGTVAMAYFVYVMVEDQGRAHDVLGTEPLQDAGGMSDGAAWASQTPDTSFDSGGFDPGGTHDAGGGFDAGGGDIGGGGFDGGGVGG